MAKTTTPTIRRKLARIACIAGPLLCGLLSFPAAALQEIGFQTIVDFDELAPGATTAVYGYNAFTISGGVVQAGSAAFPALSSPNVYYAAQSVTTSSIDGYSMNGADGWSYIGASVTPSTAPVTATFSGYPGYAWPPYLPVSVTTVGFAPNQLLSFADFGVNLFEVSFASSAPFALDNLTYGLPDVPPGIPEPATWLLLLVGFGGLALATRRAGGYASLSPAPRSPR